MCNSEFVASFMKRSSCKGKEDEEAKRKKRRKKKEKGRTAAIKPAGPAPIITKSAYDVTIFTLLTRLQLHRTRRKCERGMSD